MASVDKYTELITPWHRGKRKFTATVSAVAQCFTDQQNAMSSMVMAFDLDNALGVQLDAVGLWVGIGRNVKTPFAGVYFSLDVAGVGFNQGVWKGPFDPTTGITTLDDDTYRLLIKAKIAANHWDGTMEQSATVLQLIFGSTAPVFIEDNQDMTMNIGLAGAPPTALFVALLTGGYVPLRPEGVRIANFVISNTNAPLFGFDMKNQYVAGFNQGAWGTVLPGQ